MTPTSMVASLAAGCSRRTQIPPLHSAVAAMPCHQVPRKLPQETSPGGSLGDRAGTNPCPRQAAGGAFQVTNEVDMSEDRTPPGQVTDLGATNLPDILQLQFTAPGNDLDSNDAAAKYIVKYSSTAGNLTTGNFDKDEFNTEIVAGDLIDSDMNPVNGGAVKTMKIRNSIFQRDEKYVIAMKAVDEAGNYSPVSNKVQVYLPTVATTTAAPATTTTGSSAPCFYPGTIVAFVICIKTIL